VINFLREIRHFLNFSSDANAPGRRIVVYAENRNYFPYFEGLIEELLARGETLSYVTSDPDDPVLSRKRRGLNAFYIRVLLALLFQRIDCDVFIMTLTDLQRYHLKRSINKKVHYVYVFHAMVSTHMMYLEGAFDHYDSILCTGKYQLDELQKRFVAKRLSDKRLVEAGYYRLERIHERYQARLESPPPKVGTMVLIAPSWGDGNILESCGKELIGLLARAGFQVVVRPHPELTKRSPALIQELRNAFRDEPRVCFELTILSDDSLISADVMICDCSGVALEYALGTLRPVLFLDVPKKIRNPGYRELGIEPFELAIRPEIGRVVDPKDIAAVPDAVRELAARKESYRDRITAVRDRSVFNFMDSSRAGARHVVELLAEKR